MSYDGVFACYLLRDLVTRSIFSFVKPLAKIFNSSGFLFSFLASFFASLKLSSELFSVFLGSVEVF
jgi:hypothetical protein